MALQLVVPTKAPRRSRSPSLLVVASSFLLLLLLVVVVVVGLMAPSCSAFTAAATGGGRNAGVAFVVARRFDAVKAPTTTPPPSSSLRMGMAQPEVEIKTKTKQATKEKQKVLKKEKVSTGEPVSRKEEEFQDAPMYKLMLLEDDSYDAEHVVERMCAIIEDLDEGAAATVFQQAMQEGKAMCGKYPFERAELFKEQLLRSNPMIFADMEEENA